jgi:hypothetical protein
MHYIETKKGLETLLKRMDDSQEELIHRLGNNLEEYTYWKKVVEGCIEEGLAMDEVDWENAPSWFRPLWRGLK